jgi:hypothetical protein
MRRALLVVAVAVIGCSEGREPPTTKKTGNLNFACNPASCGLARFTLQGSLDGISGPLDFGVPPADNIPPFAQFSCDSAQLGVRWTGTAIADDDPETVGRWVGQVTLGAGLPAGASRPPDRNTAYDPFTLVGTVVLPDGTAWSGFFMVPWVPGGRTCEIVDGVMRIRIAAPLGLAITGTDPAGDTFGGAAAGTFIGSIDIAPDPSYGFIVISSSFVARVLDPTDPASITLSPSFTLQPLGAAQTFVANVEDFGAGSAGAVPGASVVLVSNRSGRAPTRCTTSASGQCSVTLASPDAPGAEVVTAFADINGDGALGLGEPSAVSQIVWGDATPPVVATAPDIVAEATGPNGAVVTFATPPATDDAGAVGGVTCSPASGSVFPLASTTVTCTAFDAAGNAGQSRFAVTVVDTTAPSISFSGNAGSYTVDQTVSIACTATDLVTSAPAVACIGGSGPAYAFNLGVNVVQATAQDDAGNRAAGTTPFTVTVDEASLAALTGQFDADAKATGLLTKHLEQALKHRDDGAARRAHLASYRRAVEREIGKTLTAEAGAILIRLVDALLGP